MSAAPAIKAALVTMLTAAFASDTAVLVSYGHPGPSVDADLVIVGSIVGAQEFAAMKASHRSREETLGIAITISVSMGGGPEAQQPVTERAFALLASLESALETDTTIAGTCRGLSHLESFEAVESDDPEILALGRVTEIDVVFRAEARIYPTGT